MVATLEKTLSETTLYPYARGTDLFFYDFNIEGRDDLIPSISEDFVTIPIKNTDNLLSKISDYSNVKINNLMKIQIKSNQCSFKTKSNQ